MERKIKQLIVCNPYEEPARHWRYDRAKKGFELVPGRRSAGFLIASAKSGDPDDPGEFRELEGVNAIRGAVGRWRSRGYPGVTGITGQLLEFWRDAGARGSRLFFCQLEAIETLIWLAEAPDSERPEAEIPSDGGPFRRLCCKMATGTGKTIVMAMAIAWQAINRETYPHDTRFSKNFLVMSPNLTIKSRLEVLRPESEGNFYDAFELVPESLRERLLRSRLAIHNWHTLMPESDPPRGVVKLGEESDAVFAKRILGHDLGDIVVINDEAHHAYRASPKQARGISKRDLERDKRWIEGLDRIHRARGITHCFDFSATPFIPSGRNASEDTLFGWIVSDFSLNDAIESGLTKTPRIAIRDDSSRLSEDYRSRFYHMYGDREVRPDLNRNAKPEEKLPDLVKNAYLLLGRDWIETRRHWEGSGSKIPPVMITICNSTSTAARVMHSFRNDRLELPELSTCEHLLHIDSSTISRAEEREALTGKSGPEEDLRRKADTVGRIGEPGEQIRNIVAVQMLSEGWDARNVTHIMGLRAFSSQLLCEQVVGRGLRRRSYEINPKTGLFSAEYVNVFGVPFTFLPHEGRDGGGPEKPTTAIEPSPSKSEHAISWPNIDRIDTDFLPRLAVDWEALSPLELQGDGTSLSVGMAQVLAGKPHIDKMSSIDLRRIDGEIRLQRIIFLAVRDVYDDMAPGWKGNREFLLIQVAGIVERFVLSGKIVVTDARGDRLREKITMLFNMQKIVAHVCKAIRDSSAERRLVRLNAAKPTKSTYDMRRWHTRKPTGQAAKSHINMAVYDSKWEMDAEEEMERSELVASWVKNDHVGFAIKYLYDGAVHDYWPDFLIRLRNNVTLILEIKGVESRRDGEKLRYLREWVDAVNEDGRFGAWTSDVAFKPDSVSGIIAKHCRGAVPAGESARCPQCGRIAQSRSGIEADFGFRNVRGFNRPQSRCRRCRAGS